MISCDMAGYRRYGEQLQSKILDASFRFSIHEKIGVDYTVVNIRKMAS